MMTFKELKKLVKLPLYKEQRVPTVKALEESGVSVVAEKILENHENRILQYFGRISLIVLCIHGPVYRVVVKIISIPLHMGTDAVREKFLLAMLVMIVTMVICSLAYEIIVRVAPWMIGKKKVKAL